MDNWILKSESMPVRYGHRRLIRREYVLPNGTKGEWYIKNEPRSVAVFALTALSEVILAKQFRPGPAQILDELPGGRIDPGETPEQAGARELLEETGYAGKVEFIGQSFDCGYSTRVKHCVVATKCEQVAEPKLDPEEVIETVLMPLDDFRAHLQSGRLTDGWIAYRALDHLGILGSAD